MSIQADECSAHDNADAGGDFVLILAALATLGLAVDGEEVPARPERRGNSGSDSDSDTKNAGGNSHSPLPPVVHVVRLSVNLRLLDRIRRVAAWRPRRRSSEEVAERRAQRQQRFGGGGGGGGRDFAAAGCGTTGMSGFASSIPPWERRHALQHLNHRRPEFGGDSVSTAAGGDDDGAVAVAAAATGLGVDDDGEFAEIPPMPRLLCQDPRADAITVFDRIEPFAFARPKPGPSPRVEQQRRADGATDLQGFCCRQHLLLALLCRAARCFSGDDGSSSSPRSPLDGSLPPVEVQTRPSDAVAGVRQLRVCLPQVVVDPDDADHAILVPRSELALGQEESALSVGTTEIVLRLHSPGGEELAMPSPLQTACLLGAACAELSVPKCASKAVTGAIAYLAVAARGEFFARATLRLEEILLGCDGPHFKAFVESRRLLWERQGQILAEALEKLGGGESTMMEVCPWGCGLYLEKNIIDDHKSVCQSLENHGQRECPLKDMGCEFRGSALSLLQHLNDEGCRLWVVKCPFSNGAPSGAHFKKWRKTPRFCKHTKEVRRTRLGSHVSKRHTAPLAAEHSATDQGIQHNLRRATCVSCRVPLRGLAAFDPHRCVATALEWACSGGMLPQSDSEKPGAKGAGSLESLKAESHHRRKQNRHRRKGRGIALFESLPADALACVFSFLTADTDVRAISLVCRRWRSVCEQSVAAIAANHSLEPVLPHLKVPTGTGSRTALRVAVSADDTLHNRPGMSNFEYGAGPAVAPLFYQTRWRAELQRVSELNALGTDSLAENELLSIFDAGSTGMRSALRGPFSNRAWWTANHCAPEVRAFGSPAMVGMSRVGVSWAEPLPNINSFAPASAVITWPIFDNHGFVSAGADELAWLRPIQARAENVTCCAAVLDFSHGDARLQQRIFEQLFEKGEEDEPPMFRRPNATDAVPFSRILLSRPAVMAASARGGPLPKDRLNTVLSVHVGHSWTSVVPIVAGVVQRHAMHDLCGVGGRLVSESLESELRALGVFVAAESKTMASIKQRLAVRPYFPGASSGVPAESAFVHYRSTRDIALAASFPDATGLDWTGDIRLQRPLETSTEAALAGGALVDTVVDAIQSVSGGLQVQAELLSNVLFSGGGAQLEGLADRVMAEAQSRLPEVVAAISSGRSIEHAAESSSPLSAPRPRVLAPRYISGCFEDAGPVQGAEAMHDASLSGHLGAPWVSKAAYDELGAGVLAAVL